ARILGKKPTLVLVASPSSMEELRSGRNSLRATLLRIAENLSIRLSSYVIAYGRSVPGFLKVEGFRTDFITDGAEFVDDVLFAPRFALRERPLAIAYVGRLAAEKGVENLWTALERTLTILPSFEAFLVGSGPLQSKLARGVQRSPIGRRVHLL